MPAHGKLFIMIRLVRMPPPGRSLTCCRTKRSTQRTAVPLIRVSAGSCGRSRVLLLLLWTLVVTREKRSGWTWPLLSHTRSLPILSVPSKTRPRLFLDVSPPAVSLSLSLFPFFTFLRIGDSPPDPYVHSVDRKVVTCLFVSARPDCCSTCTVVAVVPPPLLFHVFGFQARRGQPLMPSRSPKT